MPHFIKGYWYRRLRRGPSYPLEYWKVMFIQDTKPEVIPEQNYISNNIYRMDESALEQKILNYE